MTCPHHWVKNGYTSARKQRWRCTLCGTSRTDGKADRGVGGRKPIGDRAMSNAERQRKWRQKHR